MADAGQQGTITSASGSIPPVSPHALDRRTDRTAGSPCRTQRGGRSSRSRRTARLRRAAVLPALRIRLVLVVAQHPQSVAATTTPGRSDGPSTASSPPPVTSAATSSPSHSRWTTARRRRTVAARQPRWPAWGTLRRARLFRRGCGLRRDSLDAYRAVGDREGEAQALIASAASRSGRGSRGLSPPAVVTRPCPCSNRRPRSTAP